MRVSDSQFSQMMLQSLQINNAGLGEVLQQMSTGKRLTKLSDSPIDSVKLLNLKQEGQAIDQYKANIKNVKTTLSSQEVYLDSANDSLKSIRDLVLWGANGSLSDEDRLSIVGELKSLQDSFITAFNAQDEEGHFLFSGTATNAEALVKTNSGYVVQGNADERVVTIAKGVTMESNVTAKEILDVGGNNVISQLDRMIAELENPTGQFSTEVSNTIDTIDRTLSNVLGAMTEIGGRYNNLDLLENSHSENKLFVDKVSGELAGLDYGEASVRLSNYVGALQATQASYLKINELSLFSKM